MLSCLTCTTEMSPNTNSYYKRKWCKKLNALIDSGSQMNYFTRCLAEEIQLRVLVMSTKLIYETSNILNVIDRF